MHPTSVRWPSLATRYPLQPALTTVEHPGLSIHQRHRHRTHADDQRHANGGRDAHETSGMANRPSMSKSAKEPSGLERWLRGGFTLLGAIITAAVTRVAAYIGRW